MQACGHMYLDEGEELSTGTAKDNLLSFSAFTAAGGNGGNSTTGQVSECPAHGNSNLWPEAAWSGLILSSNSRQSHAPKAWLDVG